MADYNGYTIKRPHSLTPLTSVFEAVAADGRPGRFALKIFHPPASTNIRRFYAIEGWLLAAEHQQRNAKKDGTVLEVLACGRCAEGAFAVLPWQERLLEPWIKTLHPKGDTLRALATCLLNTLEAWEAQTGGPHGNLKPSNVFLDRTGPLVGMAAQLSDPAFLPGAKTEALRLADLAAVGTMLATIVRRRPPGAWPIEEAPEWKALGNPGKGWLDFCNYLLNPQPGEGEVTLAQARLRLKKVPKDANPVKTAVLTIAAVLVLGAVGVVGFARFGNYIYMPEQVQRLAVMMNNPSVPKDVPPAWAQLCAAWDTWLVDLQSNAPRLLRTEGLLDSDDELRRALTEFVAEANSLRPEALIPQAAGEKRLGVLGNTPPDVVFNELLIGSVRDKVAAAGNQISTLNLRLENWQRWDQLRALQKRMIDNQYTQVAGRLASRLPPVRGSADYGKQNVVRTLKFLNDLSLDDTGTLPLASRWSEISHLQADMLASGDNGDRIQKAMPKIILDRLVDKSSLSAFADSLVRPLEEMRLRRKHFLDPSVVRERFLKESPLQAETAAVTEADFPRWEQELVLYSLVPTADDPRLDTDLDASVTRLPRGAVDLEEQAPAGEPGGLPTLSQADFQREFTGLTTGLKALRDRPIVRRDLPAIGEETVKVAGAFTRLEERLNYTLTLLRPDTWLAKVAQAYGTFNETRQRWAAWQQATLPGLTAAVLEGAANRPRFRQLRANERLVKDWINGVEGDTGFGALVVPDLAAATPDTAAELKRLEAVRREQQVSAVAQAAEWRNALPVTPWVNASASVRKPLEDHREWLAQLLDFAKGLDRLGALLTDGFGWTEEDVKEVAEKLAAHPGVDALTGRPAEWTAEAKQLERLANAGDRGVLTAAAQSGGLSRKLMAWRRLGTLAGWPAGAEDFDVDTGVVTVMREFIGRDVKDEARRTGLLQEMVTGTRNRFNKAARAASRVEAQVSAMFERMPRVGLTDADLDEPVAYNFALWRLKGYDKNEKNLDRLRVWRDGFVTAVSAISGIKDLADVRGFVGKLSELELKDDPNRPLTPSPGLVGWQEELTNEGLALTATWSSGGRKVSLEYSIVQPADNSPAFYLAKREMAVGEFLDLLAGRPKEEVAAVLGALPPWTRSDAAAKPYNRPMAWRPRFDSNGNNNGLELNPTWITYPTSDVKGLLDNTELHASVPALGQVVAEKPTLRSPLQQVPPTVAKILVEKLMGARLPTPKEWQAVLQVAGTPPRGYFRGPVFQNLFTYLRDYNVAGQKVDWRPNAGAFPPMVTTTDPATGKPVRRKFADDGQAGAGAGGSRLWFAPVDEGPVAGDFVNLTGNVSIFLCDNSAAQPQFYVAGGSILSPPGIDFTQPQKVETAGLIGARPGTEAYSDVGIRPAFDAPPGFRERYKLLVLVRQQKYLTL